MTYSLFTFQPVKGFTRIYTARKNNLRCIAVKMKSGGLSLHSPVTGLDDNAIRSLNRLGNVDFLLAPNHYHNKGIKVYAQAFPAAELICSGKAKSRLQKQTRFTFSGIEEFIADLPRHLKLFEPEGLKTGEVWLTIRNKNKCAWIVTDAFCGTESADSQPANTPGLLGTFPKYGVQDHAKYKRWVKNLLETDPPNLIIPGHGGLIESANLVSDIHTLLNTQL
ncbi:MAG: hypothetical protein KTR18_01855 [Acidiferrobacterales bacterium]|nr:hypothetical protein [Acidiferrobacterales bacterium]